MLPPSFGNLPNYGGDANMVTPSILSPHGMNSRGNSKKQFSPTDAEKKAHGCLRRLKQSGSIHDYVKEFTTLTFEIEDLSDKDHHFLFFMDGLKDWARVELERRNVQDLGTAITDTESPTDLTRSKESKYIHGEGGDKPKDNDRKDDGRSKSPNGDNRRDRPNGGKPTVIKSKSSCFICDEPYWIYAFNGRAVSSTLAKRALMFVGATIKGKRVHAMLDTRATYNFILVDEAKGLGLRVTNEEGVIKAPNSLVKQIDGTVKGITVHLGP
ncbi:hypothetical protein EZV62_007850 [Acer yangbiense]|uniref:Retrotransposon gag domain-containing protein n=1 Tax=Acer yangbiense TaxID=1000413 RepID=A0A5C7IBF8_9ROSI|nr:hypothetical protein EZV62_007850 [Acer yangbiense]